MSNKNSSSSKKRRQRFRKIIHLKFKEVNCQYCDTKLSFEKTTIDHFFPLDRGGCDSFMNYRISCYPCNVKKGNNIETFDPGCLISFREFQIFELVGAVNFVTMYEKNLI